MAEMQPLTKSSFILKNEMYSSTIIFIGKCNANGKREKNEGKESKTGLLTIVVSFQQEP